ncbi:MAG: hypothetical protein ABW199_01795 [Caulobacterales bacterium]
MPICTASGAQLTIFVISRKSDCSFSSTIAMIQFSGIVGLNRCPFTVTGRTKGLAFLPFVGGVGFWLSNS